MGTDNSLEELALSASNTRIIKLSKELEDIMSTFDKDRSGSYTIDRKTFEETYAIYIFKQYKNGFKTVSFEDILNIMGIDLLELDKLKN